MAASDLASLQAGVAPQGERVRQLVGERPKVRYLWQLPQAVGPEIVLVGRSNAGKSTLLNALLASRHVKQEAAVSSKGGRTRTLNWYPLGFKRAVGWTGDGSRMDQQAGGEVSVDDAGHGFCLVDCFGLGPIEYALQARRLQSWGPLLYEFLCERRALIAVAHLVSSEFDGVLQEGDEQLLEIFQRAVQTRRARDLEAFSYVPVLTKIDMHPPNKLPGMVEKLRKDLIVRKQPVNEVVTCSSVTKDGSGIAEISNAIDTFAAHGWAAVTKWAAECSLPRDRMPAKRSPEERHEAWESYKSGRTYDGKLQKGGRGAKTSVPPSL